MRYLAIDTECTCLKLHHKNLDGNPFADVNKLCYVGLRTHDGEYLDFKIEYDDSPYGDNLRRIQEIINAHDTLIGFNLKFDLHWLRRYGVLFDSNRVFDTQVVEFICNNQSTPYPALNDTAISYGLAGKTDVVKEEYWNKGIDTDKVPEEILRGYLQNDVEQTYQVFLKQQERIQEPQRRIISLANQDLLALEEIEWNGMLYDVKSSTEKGDSTQEILDEIDRELVSLTCFPHFNAGSGDHISAILYGGTITIPVKQPYIFTYKDGRTTEKTKWVDVEHKFERLVEPLKGSELKKEGFFATNADTLNSIRPKGKAKQIVSLLLKRAEFEKLVGTYLHGLPKLIKEEGWEEGMIHGNLNQCVAITGRLSSSKPNLQNMDKSISYLFRSRYG